MPHQNRTARTPNLAAPGGSPLGFEWWHSTSLSRLGSSNSVGASQVSVGTGEDGKEARRCMSLGFPPLQKTKAQTWATRQRARIKSWRATWPIGTSPAGTAGRILAPMERAITFYPTLFILNAPTQEYSG